MNMNPMCDGSHCYRTEGEVRLLPYGGDGNMIFCIDCFIHEINWRRHSNMEAGKQLYEIPVWRSLKIYEGAK